MLRLGALRGGGGWCHVRMPRGELCSASPLPFARRPRARARPQGLCPRPPRQGGSSPGPRSPLGRGALRWALPRAVRGCFCSPFSAHIQLLCILRPMLRDILLAAIQIIPLHNLKHPGRVLRVSRVHLNQPSGGWVHGGQAHHIRLVLAQAFGALDGVLLPLQLFQKLRLLLLVIGKVGLVLAGDFIQGALASR